MFKIIFLSSFLAFLITLISTPRIIKYLRGIDLTVKDMNKKSTPLVPTSGGLAVFVGLFVGMTFYIFYQTFLNNNVDNVEFLLAALISITIITFVGFIDDLMVREDRESTFGLKQWQKPLLVLPAAIPLMAVNSGITKVYVPLLGTVNLGILFPLVVIPIAVVGAANMVNLLAGFNGSEAGMGIIYTTMLAFYAYFNGNKIATVIGLIVAGSLLAFYLFNKYPAKILPGDSLTYLLGAVIAVMAVLGNIEKAALIASIPFFIEFVLKLRGRFKPQSYGYYKNGKVQSRYRKIYSIPHFLSRTGKFTEKQISYFMMLIVLIFSSLIWVL